MAWNEPGNKGNDPWGNKGGNDKGPPDLDDVFRNLAKRFGGKGNGGSGFSMGTLAIVAGIALAVWGFSGFYTIKEAEQGVVLRFGEHVGEVGPGLHWKATFVDSVLPVDVSTVRSIPASGSMLTADENMVVVELDVQYKVKDAYQYLFSAVDANSSLREATDSALRYVIGHSKMNDILTTGRAKVRDDTRAEIERIIAPYNLGLQIEDVNFLPARPPEEVKDAFDDAISAQEDEHTYIRQAEAYQLEIEPKARGQVERIKQDARAYKERVIQDAEGAVAKFNKLLPEYKQAPEVTRDRLYIDAMQQVFSDTNKVLIDAKNNGNLMYLPLDKLMSQEGKPKPKTEQEPEQQVDAVSSQRNTNSSSFNGRMSREERMRQGRE
ncbi:MULTISPECIES: FtsH protease activity modulator HflK [Shewanella]|jgi:membrane protease subunit HflK|uniref:FtsH protease activity modulator HflK n=1 Tax=Shewanella TaxID=22 RepID=UPI0005CD73E6|nr:MULTISPECIES: FtsH protease activity modulator HflK [Shewanella]MBO2563849.1 FtsH protease activity modulator HflK [Shewanella algae]MBO2599397.1 FtsH protease activity modulator HflK [Shewanella algae]MBO2635693.1 FtsH protease activity modulator HflK [Shewanella algae]MBO2656875.1 FtsH protease activity modulator HflK [Shewanella algae]MDC8854510.1 FtsH protease activity modulator HflK [Shewanella algae]